MISLAWQILAGGQLEEFNRLEIKQKTVASMLAKRLTAGASCRDAWADVTDALRFTDTAMSDFTIQKPIAYARARLNKKAVTKKEEKDFKAERFSYWQSHFEKAMEAVKVEKESGNDFALEMNANIAKGFLAKMKECKS